MKVTKYICLYFFLIILLMFSLLNSGCGENSDLKAMEKRSIKAVHKAYGWTKKEQLKSRLRNLPLFSKTLFFWVRIPNFSPPQIFIVAIDKRTKNAYFVLVPYSGDPLEKDIENFSKIIAKESLIIDQSNIENYITSFLLLISKRSKLIDSIDDIKYLPDSTMSDIKKDFPNIRPPKYDFKGTNISIEFYSYSNLAGYLLKWDLIISQNGEVLSYKFKEFDAGKVMF